MSDCIYCGRWRLKASDEYCSGCGKLPLNVTVDPEKIFLRGIEGQSRSELTLHNRGTRTVTAEIVTDGVLPAFLSCAPAEVIPLAPDERKSCVFTLDHSQLPRGMTLNDYRFRCRLDGSDRRAIPFEVRVVPGPKPEPSASVIDFGKVERGRPVRFDLEIANVGGLPFVIQSAAVEGHPEIRAAWEPNREPVKAGARAVLPVVWEDPSIEVPPAARLRVRFSHGLPDLELPVAARMVTFALEADPPEVRNPCALSREEVSVTVTLRNTGTEKIDVTAIESDQDWLRVFSPQSVFSLVPPGPGRGAPAGGNVFTGYYPFTVIYIPDALTEGPHTGTVTILTGHPDLTLRIPVHLEVRQPEGDYPHYIGIDFGTTNSCVSVWDEAENRAVLVPEDPTQAGSPTLIPSYLVFKGSPDQYDIGTPAKNQIQIFPEFTCRSLKRIMGHTQPREFFGRRYQPHELAALILRRLVRMAERHLFELSRRTLYLKARWAIVTVPADFYDSQIRGVLEAVKLSGLEIAESSGLNTPESPETKRSHPVHPTPYDDAGSEGVILDEPSAAALFFFQHIGRLDPSDPLRKALDDLLHVKRTLRALVYDHGGGTLDVSIVEIRLDTETRTPRIRMRVLTNNGDNQVGGEYIDLAILRYVLQRCKIENPDFADDLISCPFLELLHRSKKEQWGRNVLSSILASRNSWIAAAEELKITLSKKPDAIFSIMSGWIQRVRNGRVEAVTPSEFKMKIKREEMENLIQKIVEKCEKVVFGAIKQSGIERIERSDNPKSPLENSCIDFVIHSGRSSMMPRIQAMIEKVFPFLKDQQGRIIKKDDLLKVCVAMGATQHGAMKARPNPAIAFDSLGRTLPHSYGLAVNDLFGLPVFEPIIKAGTPYPADQGKSYAPDDIPPSGWLNLHFYQHKGTPGDGIRISSNPDFREIGSIQVNANADGKPGADVVFRVSANRMLEVEVDGREVNIRPPVLIQEDLWAG